MRDSAERAERQRGAMPTMHEYTPETEALTEAIVDYTRRRIADPQPLDHPVPPAELTAAAGPTITPAGIGGEEALRIWADVLAPATITTDHPSFLAFVPGAPSKASVLFDLAVSASEVYGGSWLEGGGAVWAENQVLGWLADLAGMPVGSGGHPREVGEPTEHLVLRPHGAASLQPAPPVDLGRAHGQVEQDACLARRARHEREEARVVGRDSCRCEHVRPDPERFLPADPRGRDRGSGGRGELGGRDGVVERLRIGDAPARVVHDGLGQRFRLRRVLVHRRHRAPLPLGAFGRVAHRSG